MPSPTESDLQAMEERAKDHHAYLMAPDVLALIAEVRRLRG